MESRRRQTITITKANFETCERFLQFCLYINLLKPNSMQHDCLKYFRILINWFGKTYYYFSMIFKNMAIHHLVNCLFYANLRTSIWGWWVTGSGPYKVDRCCSRLIQSQNMTAWPHPTVTWRSPNFLNFKIAFYNNFFIF